MGVRRNGKIENTVAFCPMTVIQLRQKELQFMVAPLAFKIQFLIEQTGAKLPPYRLRHPVPRVFHDRIVRILPVFLIILFSSSDCRNYKPSGQQALALKVE